MNARPTFALVTLCLMSLSWAPAEAGVFIGVGVPGPYYRPYHHHYYGPRVYVAPAPVYVQPVPVYAQPAPVYVQPAPVYAQPAPPAPQPQVISPTQAVAPPGPAPQPYPGN